MKSGESLGRVGAVLVVAAAAIAAALVGGASTGRAATSFSFVFKPLIGTPVTNVIPQVSYGGAIGYSIHIENSGDSNTTQVFIRAKNTNGAIFLDATNPNCAKNSSDAQQMICSLPGDTLRTGETFDTNFRFTAPSTGTQVSMTVEVVIKAQSVGGKKNGTSGTTVSSSPAILTNIVAGGDKDDTYLRANETAKTGNLSADHQQKFSLTTPGTLIGNPFGTPVSIHDTSGSSLCGSCLNAFTTLTLPDASFVNTPGNPFYDGTSNTFNPYSWTVDAKYPNGFQFHGIFHFEDGSNVQHQIPSCASLLPTQAPTVAEPLCWDTLDQINNQKLLSATGRGLENGNITFG
jgi:hypothetical protein